MSEEIRNEEVIAEAEVTTDEAVADTVDASEAVVEALEGSEAATVEDVVEGEENEGYSI